MNFEPDDIEVYRALFLLHERTYSYGRNSSPLHLALSTCFDRWMGGGLLLLWVIWWEWAVDPCSSGWFGVSGRWTIVLMGDSMWVGGGPLLFRVIRCEWAVKEGRRKMWFSSECFPASSAHVRLDCLCLYLKYIYYSLISITFQKWAFCSPGNIWLNVQVRYFLVKYEKLKLHTYLEIPALHVHRGIHKDCC